MEKIDKTKNDNNISLYDNLKLFNEQDDIYINSIYNISYLTYKKQLFNTNINNDYNLLINLFDENICNILINIFILKKKNKITNNQYKIFKFIFDYIKLLNEINYIDQENFLLLIMDFYKIKNLCILINIFFENNIFKELIDYKTIIYKVNNLYLNLSEKFFLFQLFNEIIEIKDINIIEQKIIYLAKNISYDLFIFYNSQQVYDIIINSFTNLNIYILDNYKNINNEQEYIKNKLLLNIFSTNKIIFMKEYEKFSNIYIDIYKNDYELYIKFKINKNYIISKFINNIEYIDNI
jgi:hypothetical protein